MKFKPISKYGRVISLSMGLLILHSSSLLANDSFSLKTLWTAAATPLSLKAWTIGELSKLSVRSTEEREPETGKLEKWKGVVISKFIEKALADLPLDQRAQVDLVIFKNSQGVESVIPRSLVTKYPLLLAFEKNHKPLGAEELTVVVPWTSMPRIASENLPLRAFYLSGVTQIELGSYREHFQTMLLKRRTDPAAIRGEKMYVQNCISCHGAGRAPSITEISVGGSRSLASTGHPTNVSGFPKLTPRDLRGLVSYLDAYRAEHPIRQAQK